MKSRGSRQRRSAPNASNRPKMTSVRINWLTPNLNRFCRSSGLMLLMQNSPSSLSAGEELLKPVPAKNTGLFISIILFHSQHHFFDKDRFMSLFGNRFEFFRLDN